jgi:hypothetical protein
MKVTDGPLSVFSEQYKIIRTLRVTTGTDSVSYGEPVAAFVELRIENHDVASGDESRKKTFGFSIFDPRRDILLMPLKLLSTGT